MDLTVHYFLDSPAFYAKASEFKITQIVLQYKHSRSDMDSWEFIASGFVFKIYVPPDKLILSSGLVANRAC